jgi:hypothetical protein
MLGTTPTEPVTPIGAKRMSVAFFLSLYGRTDAVAPLEAL